MVKLSQFFKNLIAKWKELSKRKKIAFGVIFAGIIAAVIFAGISLGTTKYAVLFSNLNSTDSANVYKQLQSDKIDAKVQGNSILVPKDQVDKVRMQVLSEVQITNGSQGFELLDKSSFGTTDEQMKITYQRALQGELERTIKGFSEVQDARVHLVIPDDTAFEKDTDPGSASVTLKLKPGQSLTKDQVKSVIALVSGAVKNVPAKNIQVMDDNMNLLSDDLYTDKNNGEQSTTSADKQQQLQKQYEENLQKRLQSMLETVYGKDKVKVTVNTELDFDDVQQDSTTYDPKSVIVSENDKKSTSNSGDNSGTSNSPVDNNMTNSTASSNGNNLSTSEETTKNYDVSKVEQKTIKAPGAVKRLTASVALDGNVDDATKTSIKNLAVSAIGYDDNRGDTISVEGIPFDTTLKDKARKDLDEMNKATEQAKKNKLYTIIGIIAAIVIAAAVGIFLWMRKNRREEEEAFDDEFGSTQSIDTIIGDDDMDTNEQPKFKPVEFEEENEQTHLENEIRKYAKDKPDQVVDVIKSWLAEDER